MGEAQVVARMRRGRDGPATLDELFKAEGERAWGPLRDAARAEPEIFDEAVVDWIASHMDSSPQAAFAALLDLAGRDAARAPRLIERYRALMAKRPGPGLAAAGYNLHEYCRLLDARWIADARAHYEADPEGGWGIATAAASYAPELMTPEDAAWFEARAAADYPAYFRMMLSLAASEPSLRDGLLRRALARFDERPKAALDAAAGVAREKALLAAGLPAAVLRRMDADPEAAWRFFDGASYESPELFDDVLLDALAARADAGAKTWFALLHRLADADPSRAPALMERFARLLPRHPKEGVDQAHYVAHNDPRLLAPALVDAVCAHFAADPYHAFDVLRSALEKRPELLRDRHVETAARHIGLATNWAFGFFRRLLELRPDDAPVCTLALFECLALEPPNRAHVRVEELQAIVTIAQASHVKTELERALREPPGVGSRRARALLAILFRQRLRAKQHVLFEALRLAATASTRTNLNRTPLWDFFLLLLDEASGKAVTTAAAERFLEGAFQLTYLMDRGVEHDAFREKFALEEAGPSPWPEGLGFLARDAELDRLHGAARELAKRCGAELRLGALEDYARRVPRAEEELAAIERERVRADGERRRRLDARREALARRLALWRDPAPGPEARTLLEQEELGLRKTARDALRAELARIAVEAVEGARLALYRSRIEAVLGRPVDLTRVDPAILPAFLFFPAIAGMPNNRKWLARLIEDRLEGRPHDWLWSEDAPRKWKESVRAGQPGIVFERWRASFAKEYLYQPRDAAAEKSRRMKDDLAQTRRLLEGLGATGLKDESCEELTRAYEALRAPREEKKEGGEKAPPPPDPRVLEEIAMNLERVRLVAQTPESDYAGRITLEVETDPFQVLFMGEYGFASCLSLRGSNVWGAVSNAVDVDKAVVWAKEAGANVVGRRLIALTPDGVVSYRTYANRHGLALDPMFADFLAAYAAHCGTRLSHGGSPGPLLSDRWYDDGAL